MYIRLPTFTDQAKTGSTVFNLIWTQGLSFIKHFVGERVRGLFSHLGEGLVAALLDNFATNRH